MQWSSKAGTLLWSVKGCCAGPAKGMCPLEPGQPRAPAHVASLHAAGPTPGLLTSWWVNRRPNRMALVPGRAQSADVPCGRKVNTTMTTSGQQCGSQ